jgi:hypothetical protein
MHSCPEGFAENSVSQSWHECGCEDLHFKIYFWGEPITRLFLWASEIAIFGRVFPYADAFIQLSIGGQLQRQSRILAVTQSNGYP